MLSLSLTGIDPQRTFPHRRFTLRYAAFSEDFVRSLPTVRAATRLHATLADSALATQSSTMRTTSRYHFKAIEENGLREVVTLSIPN
jgi:hypothetical protein